MINLNCSCFCHIINILLTELSRSVWENLDLGLYFRSVLHKKSHFLGIRNYGLNNWKADGNPSRDIRNTSITPFTENNFPNPSRNIRNNSITSFQGIVFQETDHGEMVRETPSGDWSGELYNHPARITNFLGLPELAVGWVNFPKS